MNSETQLQILNTQTEEQRIKKEAEQKKEAKIADEASDAIGFENHPFWQMMKRDLEEISAKITGKVMYDETLTKYSIDKLRMEAKNIKLFLEHPKLYIQKLKDLLARKRISEKRNIRGRKGNENG